MQQAQPDPSQAYGGTWHDATFDPSYSNRNTPQTAIFDFTGTALYVFGIQSHSTTEPVSGADLTFWIDGVQKNTYAYTPTQTDDSYTYNKLLFAIEGLEDASHAFTFQNGQTGGPISLVLFDYLIYTKSDASDTPSISDTSPPPTSSSSAAPSSTPSPTPSPTPTSPGPSPPASQGTTSQAESPPSPGVSSSSTGTSQTGSSAGSKSGSSSSPGPPSPTSGSSTPSSQRAAASSSVPSGVSTQILTATTTSSSPSVAPNVLAPHSHDMSSAMRTVVIVIAIVVPAIIVVLLVLVCKARHRRRADPIPNHDPLPNGAFANLASFGATQDELLPNDPAPSYFSASYHPGSAAQESPARRLSEKARYVPVQGPSAPSSWRGWSDSEDGEGSVAGGGGAGRAISERAESVYPGSSLAAVTMPPSYQSESEVAL